MSKQRRTFTREFKREAAILVVDQGYSLAEAACSLRPVRINVSRLQWACKDLRFFKFRKERTNYIGHNHSEVGNRVSEQPKVGRDTGCDGSSLWITTR